MLNSLIYLFLISTCNVSILSLPKRAGMFPSMWRRRKLKIDTLEDMGISGTTSFKGMEGVSLGGTYKVISGSKFTPDRLKIGSTFEVSLLSMKYVHSQFILIFPTFCFQLGGGRVPDMNLDSTIDVDITGAGVGLDLVAKPKGSKVLIVLRKQKNTLFSINFPPRRQFATFIVRRGCSFLKYLSFAFPLFPLSLTKGRHCFCFFEF